MEGRPDHQAHEHQLSALGSAPLKTVQVGVDQGVADQRRHYPTGSQGRAERHVRLPRGPHARRQPRQRVEPFAPRACPQEEGLARASIPSRGPAQPDNRGATPGRCQTLHPPHARHGTVRAISFRCHVLQVARAPARAGWQDPGPRHREPARRVAGPSASATVNRHAPGRRTQARAQLDPREPGPPGGHNWGPAALARPAPFWRNAVMQIARPRIKAPARRALATIASAPLMAAWRWPRSGSCSRSSSGRCTTADRRRRTKLPPTTCRSRRAGDSCVFTQSGAGLVLRPAEIRPCRFTACQFRAAPNPCIRSRISGGFSMI